MSSLDSSEPSSSFRLRVTTVCSGLSFSRCFSSRHCNKWLFFNFSISLVYLQEKHTQFVSLSLFCSKLVFLLSLWEESVSFDIRNKDLSTKQWISLRIFEWNTWVSLCFGASIKMELICLAKLANLATDLTGLFISAYKAEVLFFWSVASSPITNKHFSLNLLTNLTYWLRTC